MGAVGEQCCWETFREVVQAPPRDNRYWEPGDCLDSPKQFFVCAPQMMLHSPLKVLKLILGCVLYLGA